MAQQENDREDLIREAVALSPRAELQVPTLTKLVTAGFRSNGACSLFFGQDPVYQFDPAGGLRRACVDGLLYRSQGSTLAQLTRVRTVENTVLQRVDLEQAELQVFRQRMTTSLQSLAGCLAAETVVVRRCHPENSLILPQLQQTLSLILQTSTWLSPPVNRFR